MTDTLAIAGDYRVTIDTDTDTDGPDGDGYGYVFTLDFRHGYRVDTVHSDSAGAPTFDLAHVADTFDGRGMDWELAERYLRMFHDVVSFDYAELHRSGPTYVFVVTRAQAESWGCPATDWPKLAGQTRETWQQWADGDVWSYAVERRELWTNAAGDTRESWEHVDSLSGMYGREYAESEARSALADIAELPA